MLSGLNIETNCKLITGTGSAHFQCVLSADPWGVLMSYRCQIIYSERIIKAITHLLINLNCKWKLGGIICYSCTCTIWSYIWIPLPVTNVTVVRHFGDLSGFGDLSSFWRFWLREKICSEERGFYYCPWIIASCDKVIAFGNCSAVNMLDFKVRIKWTSKIPRVFRPFTSGVRFWVTLYPRKDITLYVF